MSKLENEMSACILLVTHRKSIYHAISLKFNALPLHKCLLFIISQHHAIPWRIAIFAIHSMSRNEMSTCIFHVTHHKAIYHAISWCCAHKLFMGGQDSFKLVRRWTHRPKGTEFDPRLYHKRRSTWATNNFSMWDNKDLFIIFLSL
jgi:hypothetical protein